MSRADRAHVFMTACGNDCVTGIKTPEESYDLRSVSEDRVLHLSLSGVENSGTLSLALPLTYRLFKVDTAPEPRLMASLYTEFRIGVVVNGTGAFQTERPTLGELVLSGISNHCMLLDQASHWTLSVESGETGFRLYGPLGQE